MMTSSHVSGSHTWRRGGGEDAMMMSVGQPNQRIIKDGRRVWVPITGGMQENGRTKVVGWASIPRHLTMVPTRDVKKIPPSPTSTLQITDERGESPAMGSTNVSNVAELEKISSVDKQSKLETRRKNNNNNKQQIEFPPQWNQHLRPTFRSKSSLRQRDLSRPFTSDSTITCQKCDVGQAVRLRTPTTSVSTHTTRARKNLLEESRKLENFRNHPLLSSHQRIRKKTSKHEEKPIMTNKNSDLIPLSFNGNGGRKIKLDGGIAECTDVCHSLNDGFVAIKQSLQIGDSFELEVQATDLWKDLFYVAVHKELDDHTTAVHKELDDHTTPVHKELHDDHTTVVHKELRDHKHSKISRYCGEFAREWIYSDELTGLKAGDRISLQFDALGRIKCIINYNSPVVLFQMTSSAPCLIALCLGLGVKRLQLLGCSKRQNRLISPVDAYSISSRLTPTSPMM